jgi:ADP-ribosyl-[dinitrogen reductase] hydrolase
MIHERLRDRVQGCAVGAAIGDALGMPLEFGPRQPAEALVREMRAGRIPAGTFTDDTEMALALAMSMLAQRPLDANDLAKRFARWLQRNPPDVGLHTRTVLAAITAGMPWEEAVSEEQARTPDAAGNGSVMRCWPVALAHANDRRLNRLVAESRLQSRVTHPHPECVAGSAFVNIVIHHLIHAMAPVEAVSRASEMVELPDDLRTVIERAPQRSREALENSGWVRHTIESAVWGLLTTDSFEEAVVQVVNLGNDADSAGAVVGAWAGAAYGLSMIPLRWRRDLRGEWPLDSGTLWGVNDLAGLANRLLNSPERT